MTDYLFYVGKADIMLIFPPFAQVVAVSYNQVFLYLCRLLLTGYTLLLFGSCICANINSELILLLLHLCHSLHFNHPCHHHHLAMKYFLDTRSSGNLYTPTNICLGEQFVLNCHGLLVVTAEKIVILWEVVWNNE